MVAQSSGCWQFPQALAGYIRLLVKNLGVNNVDQVKEEIVKLSNQYSPEGYCVSIRHLLDQLDFRDQSSQRDQLRISILKEVIKEALSLPGQQSVIYRALQYASVRTENFLDDFCQALQLSLEEGLSVTIAILESNDAIWRKEGERHLKHIWDQIIQHVNQLSSITQHRLQMVLRKHLDRLEPQHTSWCNAMKQVHNSTNNAAPNGLTHSLIPGISSHPVTYDSIGEQSLTEFNELSMSLDSSDSLAAVLLETGPAVSHEEASITELIRSQGSLNESQVAEVLAMMVSHKTSTVDPQHQIMTAQVLSQTSGNRPPQSLDTPNTWNHALILRAIVKSYPTLNWNSVAEHIHKFPIPTFTEATLAIFTQFFTIAKNSALPSRALTSGVWKVPEAQISALEIALFRTDGQVDWSDAKEQIDMAAYESSATPQPWSTQDLYQILCDLGDAGHVTAVVGLLKRRQVSGQAQLLIGLASCDRGSHVMQEWFCRRLVPDVMRQYPDTLDLLRTLWQRSPELLCHSMQCVYSESRQQLQNVLQICISLNVLKVVLDRSSLPFAIDLAVCASQQRYLQLSVWLDQKIEVQAAAVLGQLLVYLEQHTAANAVADGPTATTETISVIVDVLMNRQHILRQPALTKLSATVQRMLLLSNDAQVPISFEAQSQHITDTVNRYLRALYTDSRDANQLNTIQEFIQHMQRHANSRDESQLRVYTGLLYLILQEFPQFPTYPDKDLVITASLLSQLMRNHLMSPLMLVLYLRLIIRHLRCPAKTKHFRFGFELLQHSYEHIQTMLSRQDQATTGSHSYQYFRAFAQQLVEITHFVQLEPTFCLRFSQLANVSVDVPSQQLPLPMAEPMTDATAVSAANAQNSNDIAGASPHKGQQILSSLRQGAAGAQRLPGQTRGSALATTPVGARLTENSTPVRGTAVSLANGADGNQSRALQGSMGDSAGGSTMWTPNTERTTVTPAKGSGATGGGDGVKAEGGAMEVVVQTPKLSGKQFTNFNVSSLKEAEESLLKAIKTPSSRQQEVLLFAINNLTSDNLEEKLEDVKPALEEQNIPWFAYYLVLKRVANEPNFITLYVSLLDKINDRQVYEATLDTTVYFSHILIFNDLKEVSERSNLRALGQWLGLLTLARNRPMLQKHFNIKVILQEGYLKSKLLSVVQFVGKVMQQVEKSIVFRPPNPWTVWVLAMLKEIHSLQNIKLNIKFEIEVLFRTLQLSLETYQGDSVLRHLMVDGYQGDYVSGKQTETGAGSQRALDGPQRGLPNGSLTSSTLTGAGAALAAGVQRPLAFGGAGGHALRQSPTVAGMIRPGEKGEEVGDDGRVAEEIIAMFKKAVAAAGQKRKVEINPALSALGKNKQLTDIVLVSAENAITQQWPTMVCKQADTAARTTVELVVKDYAQEGDEAVVKQAAMTMAGSLASSLIYTNCSDTFIVTASKAMRVLLERFGIPALLERAGVGEPSLEQTVKVLTQDNLEFLTQIMQRVAAEKARALVDVHLQPHYSARASARASGVPFTNVQQIQMYPNLPPSLRPRSDLMLPDQRDLYELFADLTQLLPPAGAVDTDEEPPIPEKSTPGMPSAPNPAAMSLPIQPAPADTLAPPVSAASALSQPVLPEDMAEVEDRGLFRQYAMWEKNLNTLVLSEGESVQYYALLHDQSQIKLMMGQFEDIIRGFKDDSVRIKISKRLFNRIFQPHTNILCMSTMCVAIQIIKQVAVPRMERQLVDFFAQVEDTERKYSKDAIDILLHMGIISQEKMDEYLNNQLKNGVRHVVHLITALCDTSTPQSDTPIEPISITYFPRLLQTLQELAPTLHTLPQYGAMYAALQNLLAMQPETDHRMQMVGSYPEPQGQRNTIIQLLEAFAKMLEEYGPHGEPKQKQSFLFSLRMFLNVPEQFELLVRQGTEVVVQHFNRSHQQHQQADQQLTMTKALDVYVRFFSWIIIDHPRGLDLLRLLLQGFNFVMRFDEDQKPARFNPKGYFRILLGLIHMVGPQNDADERGWVRLQIMAVELFNLQPLSMPSFTYCWFELLTSKAFLPKMIAPKQRRLWPIFTALLTSHLKFLEPYLRSAQLNDAVRGLYKATLRLVLVILHDYQEYLCHSFYPLCDCIPASCIQLRNLILCAYPLDSKPPDPFNLQLEQLGEFQHTAPGEVPLEELVPSEQLRTRLDANIGEEGPSDDFIKSLCEEVILHPKELQGTLFNVKLLSAVVWYVSLRTRPNMKELLVGRGRIKPLKGMVFFLKFATALNNEGRYFLLNAIANHLRYVSDQTFYYACVLLYMFKQSSLDVVKEQITRVLLERIFVDRPHPWGLTITGIELVKNDYYKLMEQSFLKNSAGGTKPLVEWLQSIVNKGSGGGDGGTYEGVMYTVLQRMEGEGDAGTGAVGSE